MRFIVLPSKSTRRVTGFCVSRERAPRSRETGGCRSKYSHCDTHRVQFTLTLFIRSFWSRLRVNFFESIIFASISFFSSTLFLHLLWCAKKAISVNHMSTIFLIPKENNSHLIADAEALLFHCRGKTQVPFQEVHFHHQIHRVAVI